MDEAHRQYREHLKRAHDIALEASKKSGPFQRFARGASAHMGRSWAFLGALMMVVVWAAVGPLFNFSQPWQLVINTGTTIITFLMVFLIQNSQNRDTIALRLKIDELILATRKAHNLFVDIEHLNEKELAAIEKELQAAAACAVEQESSKDK